MAPASESQSRATSRGEGRDALCEGLARAGWDIPPPRATMFVWAEIPEAHRARDNLPHQLHALHGGFLGKKCNSGHVAAGVGKASVTVFPPDLKVRRMLGP
jgi:aspartate/methionine/tyrosine aminotransferase